MTRRIRPSLRGFAVVTALLFVALPAQADDIDPEPYVEEAVEPEPEPEVDTGYGAKAKTAATSNEPSVGAIIYDCAVLRPFGFAATLLGAVFFVPVAALTSAGGAGNIQMAWEILVVSQVENTFTRSLGDF